MKDIVTKATRSPLLRKATAITAAAVLLLSGGTALAYYTPASYASVDINPSIEFQLNVFGQVIGVLGVNDDGKALLAHITTGADLSQNIQAVVQEAATEGYLKPDSENTVVVSIANNNVAQAQQYTEEAKEQAEAAMKAAGTAGEIEVDRVGYDRVQEARKLGTTPGKLNLVQKYIESCGAAGAQVDVNEWLKKPVKEIMKAIKANRMAAQSAQAAASTTPSATDSATPTTEPSATASATDSATPAVTDSGTPAAALSPSPSAKHGDDSDIDEDNDEQGDDEQGEERGDNQDNDDKDTHDNNSADHHDADKPEKTQKHIKTHKPAATPNAHSWNGRGGEEHDNDQDD